MRRWRKGAEMKRYMREIVEGDMREIVEELREILEGDGEREIES